METYSENHDKQPESVIDNSVQEKFNEIIDKINHLASEDKKILTTHKIEEIIADNKMDNLARVKSTIPKLHFISLKFEELDRNKETEYWMSLKESLIELRNGMQNSNAKSPNESNNVLSSNPTYHFITQMNKDEASNKNSRSHKKKVKSSETGLDQPNSILTNSEIPNFTLTAENLKQEDMEIENPFKI